VQVQKWTWLLIVIISLSVCFLIISIFNKFPSSTKLPPGPPSIPILTSFLWLCRSPLQIESLLRSFVAKYGRILTLPIGASPAIFIADCSIAHKSLVQNAALFADRPPALATNKIISTHQYNLASAPYGPLWRLLRRNLTSQILRPFRIKAYARARKWVLDLLLNRFLSHSRSGTAVCVVHHFHYAMFCLLALMYFGDTLDESRIKGIENVQREMLINLPRFVVLNFWPKLTNILFHYRKVIFSQLRRKQEKVLIPLINARKKAKQERENREKSAEIEEEDDGEFVVSYIDTLLELELPDEKRKLTNDEMVTLCSEFLNAGTDTTSTALQWIMANLVKYPEIQNKLFSEMKGVMGDGSREEVKEEDLGKLPYLKAVVLEGLRRHPPVHFVIPHAVKEDTELENYVIPKNGSVSFMVAEMGWDPKVWENPMEFKPERFMKSSEEEEEEMAGFDVTGSKEIKMMPFRAGRRICPAIGLAMLHLEYFIANLVWRFRWQAVDEDGVDLAEMIEFTVVMKKPLKVNIYSRF
ncbi:cytochrome P450 89A2-like, partial [Benincasa hispida]|uniref:cytochrome P450 89A2-like n=1 Tax=Benincasa hispida TaxID=102211 RepID=UPI001900C7E0